MSLGTLSGGPGQYVPVIISAAWNKATTLSEGADTRIDEAIALTAPAPKAPNPDVIVAPALPTAPTLTSLNLPAATALYDSTSSDLIDTLTGLFAGFLAEHFPAGENDYTSAAQEWITRALTAGGSGVNAAVEAQIWNRARDRALLDANRNREALEADWASRRFPVPPGALRYGQIMIDKTAQDSIAEAARAQATEAFSREVENARIAVERAVSLRSLALSTANEYIRTLIQGPQVAAGVASSITDSQTRFSATLTDFYRAQISAVEIPLRVSTTNAELKVRTNESNVRIAMDTLTQRVNAAVSSAQMAATQAAAAFNAINTQASVSGNDSTVTSIEG
jgi:hypothetical protein